MKTLIFIGLLGTFAYHCAQIGKNFKGSSFSIEFIMTIFGFVGTLLYYGTIVWSFWHFPWWQPIITFIIAIPIGGFSAIFFQRNIFGVMISPILTIIFAILSVISLI